MSDTQGLGRTSNDAGKPMIGILDFSYAPYALGDTLTWQMNLAVGAHEAGATVIDQYIMIDPRRPSGRWQPHINTHNYISVIDGLFPAFLCCPMLRSIKVFRDRANFNCFLLTQVVHRRPTWPSLLAHLNRRIDYISHRRIDAFFRRHGYLPLLEAPQGYGPWADQFVRERCGGRFVVCVHIRQRALEPGPAGLHRDSPPEAWHEFFAQSAVKYPQVLFVVVGSFVEWDRRLLRLQNVLIPRLLGLGLAHELAILHRSRLFMGSSSGFAAMATFCGVPYVITNYERAAARAVGIPIGTRHYLFATPAQWLIWERETPGLLGVLFDEMWHLLGASSDEQGMRQRISSKQIPSRTAGP